MSCFCNTLERNQVSVILATAYASMETSLIFLLWGVVIRPLLTVQLHAGAELADTILLQVADWSGEL
jgi:hypothetical protein